MENLNKTVNDNLMHLQSQQQQCADQIKNQADQFAAHVAKMSVVEVDIDLKTTELRGAVQGAYAAVAAMNSGAGQGGGAGT